MVVSMFRQCEAMRVPCLRPTVHKRETLQQRRTGACMTSTLPISLAYIQYRAQFLLMRSMTSHAMHRYYILQDLRMSAAASNVCSTMLILPQAFQLPLGLLTDTVR